MPAIVLLAMLAACGNAKNDTEKTNVDTVATNANETAVKQNFLVPA
jgi:hypothetical protein